MISVSMKITETRTEEKDSKGFYIAPKPIRDIVEKLPYIDCVDSQGNPATCTKIPEVIHVYLTGRY